MPPQQKKQFQNIPDFDVLSEDPKTSAYILKERLHDAGFENVKIITKPSVGDDIILTHYEIVVDNDTICFIYKAGACYSYNELKINNKVVKIATIETMLLFLLSFIYADRPYYDSERILCMANYLIKVQEKNRLEQKGLLKRFNINCYGYEPTIVELRGKKAALHEKYKNEKNTKEYEKYFLKYIPIKGKYSNKYKNNKLNKFNKLNNKTKKKYFSLIKQKKTRKNAYKNVLFGNLF